MVDRELYGDLISSHDEPKFQINLPVGKHECYLKDIPKLIVQKLYKLQN
jgi:hypothetical protein